MFLARPGVNPNRIRWRSQVPAPKLARRPRRTFFALQHIVQKMALEQGKTDIAISFRRGSRRVDLRNAERDPELMARIPWLQRKFLRFRAVPISRRRECSW